MKKIISTSIYTIICGFASLTGVQAMGEIPAGYYDNLVGKSGEALKEAVKSIANPETFTHISYATDSWNAFLRTDVRTINGVDVWWDMYSNNAVPTTGHNGMNIEHSVANSWFGKKAGCPQAYADLFHLNPSDQVANGQKSNNPLGVVSTVAWENGLVKTGAPKVGTAGSATKVFEPADEYKGDFARAYLYIFTVYDTAPWEANPMYTFNTTAQLEPWAVEMLCKWAKEDPVDSKEINRNNAIFDIQKNRNPYIDYPALVDFVWGDKKNSTFTSADAKEAVAIDRPAEPVFMGKTMHAVNTYCGRWWEKETIGINHEDGDLWVSVNGGDYQQYGPGVSIPAAGAHGVTHKLSAYTETEKNGYTLRSSVATLNLTALNPDADDYAEAVYVPVRSTEDFEGGDNYYIIRAASNGHVMGHAGGTTSQKFMSDAGVLKFGEVESNEKMEGIPTSGAIVKFKPTSGGKYLIEISDPLHANSKGYWTQANNSNANTLTSGSGSAASVTIDENGLAKIVFNNDYSLQYNESQPRFTNYKTSQGGVKLFRFSKFIDVPSGTGEVEEDQEGAVAIDGHNIYLPQGWLLFAINGRRTDGRDLEAGIYIARSPKGKAIKVLIGK